MVTTELILIEDLNYYSSYGSQLRRISSQVVQVILSDHAIEIVPQTQDLFFLSLTLYEQRLEKGYSMVDCISMIVTRNKNLSEVLTHDKHFTQKGFSILL